MTQASNLGKGGSNFNSSGQLSLTTGVTGTLPVANGGTGSTTLAANNVLLGNGTSALQTVAPGTSGNILTSNGTTWTSAAAPSGGFSGATTNAVGSSAITLTNASTQYQVAQINSAANSIVNLPNATTLTVKGFAPFVIENRSPISANLNIKDAGGTVVGFIPAGYIGTIALLDNSTSAGTWKVNVTNIQTFYNWDTTSITSTLPWPQLSSGGYGPVQIVGLTSTSFIRMVNRDVTNTSSLLTQVCTISGSTITLGSVQTFTINTASNAGSAGSRITPIRLSNSQVVLMTSYYNTDDQGCGSNSWSAGANFRIMSISGTTVTVGSSNSCSMPSYGSTPSQNVYRQNLFYQGFPVRLSDTSYAVLFNNSMSSTYYIPTGQTGTMSCTVVTVSGTTTQTVGTTVALSGSTYALPQSAAALSSTSLFVCYGQLSAAQSYVGRTKLVVVSISGTTPTWGTPVNVESADTQNTCGPDSYSSCQFPNGAVAPSATQVLFNAGYFVGEATVSGTTPTFDSVSANQQVYPVFLASSTKAWSTTTQYNKNQQNNYNSYFTFGTGGTVWTTNGVNIVQPNSFVNSPVAYSPLGAQPTTAYVGINSYSSTGANTGQQVLLGNTL